MSNLVRIGGALIICLGLVIGILALVGSFSTSALITAGPSRHECLEPNFDDSGLAALQTAVTSFDTTTKSTVTCVLAYLNGAATWSKWVQPWVTESIYGYSSWVAEAPQSRQLVLQVDLIPDSLENQNDPLGWEQSCARGQFDVHAGQLGKNLVAAGLENTVIRLGAEMNGPWEADFVGTTTAEQHLWATCFANEVTALRQAPGAHFLIVWNPDACTENIPYLNFYPGNAYVDILGLDLYDGTCTAPSGSTAHITWKQLVNEPAGLASFEAFANTENKPMSFPEWGLLQKPNGDDPDYVNGIGSTFTKGDFAFESYFDANDDGNLQLGTGTPLSLAAFQKWFGNTTK
jgi:hypothetical protein